MHSREGTLMQYMQWMEERLTVLEKRLPGPPSGVPVVIYSYFRYIGWLRIFCDSTLIKLVPVSDLVLSVKKATYAIVPPEHDRCWRNHPRHSGSSTGNAGGPERAQQARDYGKYFGDQRHALLQRNKVKFADATFKGETYSFMTLTTLNESIKDGRNGLMETRMFKDGRKRMLMQKSREKIGRWNSTGIIRAKPAYIEGIVSSEQLKGIVGKRDLFATRSSHLWGDPGYCSSEKGWGQFVCDIDYRELNKVVLMLGDPTLALVELSYNNQLPMLESRPAQFEATLFWEKVADDVCWSEVQGSDQLTGPRVNSCETYGKDNFKLSNRVCLPA
ncbi:hypothetical protein Tco_0748121 [Tanacetum coccineum]|uniref:Uncharacterized protein n=1 Tax=Tanacetum coccineum TaxID=301880 RepID=A0ABQ4YXA8_9ASTR